LRTQRIVFEGRLPTMNEIIAAQAPIFHAGSRRVSKYSEWKKARLAEMVLQMRAQRIKPVDQYPVAVQITVYVKDRRHDPDNIIGGAQKFVFDALKHGGIIRNDGWSELVLPDHTLGGRWLFVDPHPRVEVTLVEDAPT